MKTNTKIIMALGILAAFMMVAVPFVAVSGDASTDDDTYNVGSLGFKFTGMISYGDTYGEQDTSVLGSISILKVEGNTIYLTGDLIKQAFGTTGTDSETRTDAFYKLWESNTTNPYAISYSVTVPNTGDKIQLGNGTEDTATNDYKTIGVMHYLDGTVKNPNSKLKYTPAGSTTATEYSFNLDAVWQASVTSSDGKSVKYYGDIRDAVSEAAAGSTVALLKDVTLTASEDQSSRALVVSKDMTIDLGGHELTVNASDSAHYPGAIDVSKASLTLKNGKITVAAIKANQYSAIKVEGENKDNTTTRASLTVQDVEIVSAEADEKHGYGIFAAKYSEVTINDGTKITADYAAVSGNGSQSGATAGVDAEITITGGTFESRKATCVYFPNTSKLNVTGGTFTGAAGFEIRAGTDVSISGATINVKTGGTLSNADAVDNTLYSPLGVAFAITSCTGYGNSSAFKVDIGKNTLNLDDGCYALYIGAPIAKTGKVSYVTSSNVGTSEIENTGKTNSTIEYTIADGVTIKQTRTGAKLAPMLIDKDGKIAASSTTMNGLSGKVILNTKANMTLAYFGGDVVIEGSVGNLTIDNASTHKIGLELTSVKAITLESSCTSAVTISNKLTCASAITVANTKAIVVADELIMAEGSSLTVNSTKLFDMVSGTLSIKTNDKGGFDAVLNGKATVSGQIVIGANDNLTIANGAELSTTATTNLVIKSQMIMEAGSVLSLNSTQLIGPNGVNITSGTMTISINSNGGYDAVLTEGSKATVTSNFAIYKNDKWTIESGAELTIAKDKSLAVTGSMVVAGTVKCNGTLAVASNTTITGAGSLIMGVDSGLTIATVSFIGDLSVDITEGTMTLVTNKANGFDATLDGMAKVVDASIWQNDKLTVAKDSVLRVTGDFSVYDTEDLVINGTMTITSTATLTVNNTEVIGSKGLVVLDNGASLTFMTNSNGGFSAVLDGKATSGELVIWTNDALAITKGSELVMTDDLTNAGFISVAGTLTLGDEKLIMIGDKASVSVTGTGKITGGSIDITGVTRTDACINVLAGGTLNTTIDGTSSKVTSTITLTNAVAGTDGMTVTKGSVIVNGVVKTGDVEIPAGSTTYVYGTLDSGVTLTIRDGAKINPNTGSLLTVSPGAIVNSAADAEVANVIFKEGSTLNGVTFDKDTKYSPSGVPQASVTITLNYDSKKLVVSQSVITAFCGDSYTDALASISVDGKNSRITFTGWYDSLGNKIGGSNDTIPEADSIELTAHFTETAKPAPIIDDDSGYDYSLVIAFVVLVTSIGFLAYVVKKR